MGLGGAFRLNIFPPVTLKATWELGGGMMTHVHVIKRLKASMGLGGDMITDIPIGRLLRAGFSLGGEMVADVAEVTVVTVGADFALGGELTANVSNETPMDADAAVIIAAMTVTPDASRQAQINDTVIALKAAGLWSLLYMLQVYAAHDEQAARVDWILPSRIATRHNVATFETDLGFRGNGTSMYLNTNWSQSDNPGGRSGTTWNYHIGAKVYGHTGTNHAVLGEVDTDGIKQALVAYHSSFSGGGIGGIGHSGGDPIFGYANADANNHAVVCINGSTKGDFRFYQNGTLRGGPTANGGSTALLSSNSVDKLLVLRNATTHSSLGCQFAHAGANLTNAQVTDLYNIMAAYLAAVAP